MKKTTFLKMVLVVMLLAIGSINSFSQTTIAGWDFSTQTGGNGNYGTSPLAVTTKDANVTIGDLTRGSGFGTLTNSGAASAWGSTNFTASGTLDGEITANKYFSFTITANTGYKVSLAGISAYNIRRSSSGPTTGQWQYQIGSNAFINIGNSITWGTGTTSSGNAQAAIDLTGISDLQNVLESSIITIRLVCYGASGTGGTNYLKDLGNTTSNDLIITGTTASTTGPILAITPSFSISTGNYFSAQNISLSSTTSGAKIYYTTDGSTPDNTKILYNSAISVATTTTIKAIAYDASGSNPSSIATATYTFPTSVATIADLRAAATPGFYKLTGEAVLTLKSATRNSKYIQDATGAVLIDDNSGIITTAYNVGDGITGITGTTALYNNMLQFTPVTDPGAATSTNNTVTPAIVELADLANNPGKLVKVLNATITGSANFTASASYNLNGSSTTVIRTQYADLNYIGQAIPTTAQDITGVVLIYNSTAQLVPRSLSDFTPTLGTSLNPVKDNSIHTENGHVILSASANQTVEIFSALGQKLLSLKAVEGMNTIPVSAKGLILVKVGNQISKVIL